MFYSIYNYFKTIISVYATSEYNQKLYEILNNSSISVAGQQFNFIQYFSFLFALISFVVVFILCCLFIYRLIRLVGRLFTGGAL